MGTSETTMEGSGDPSDHPMLYLECEEEPLSSAQLSSFENKRSEFQKQMRELQTLSARAFNFTINSESAVISVPDSLKQLNSSYSTDPIPNPTLCHPPPVHVPPAYPKDNPKYRLIMDPKTGRIIGTVDSNGEGIGVAGSIKPINIMKPLPPTTRAPFPNVPPNAIRTPNTIRSPNAIQTPNTIQPPNVIRNLNTVRTPSTLRIPNSFQSPNLTIHQPKKTAAPVIPPHSSITPVSSIRQPVRFPSLKPTPPPPLIPLTTDPKVPIIPAKSSDTVKTTNSISKPDSVSTETPPKPVVKVSRPVPATLSVLPKASKTLPTSQVASTRKQLDTKVKGLLIRNSAKFTEFLIRQGLIPTNQYSVYHGKKKELKLGIYSDEKKFPLSGGYVWINEKEPTIFYSVFEGSIFNGDSTGCSPITILKLIYHWACQTDVQNVVQWVKVDIEKIDQYFGMFRTICSLSENGHERKLGGTKKRVQIGVISLGTTSSDGSRKEVRVEVLGILEVETGKIKLRATLPPVSVTQSKRFRRIFNCLPSFVELDSLILTDYSVDKEELNKLGFNTIQQSYYIRQKEGCGNSSIMNYLKRIVPKMFQSNLSQLAVAQVQQFLDELTFRESFNHPLACFDNIIKQIAQVTQTTSIKSINLMELLSKAEKDPFSTRIKFIVSDQTTPSDLNNVSLPETSTSSYVQKTSGTKRPSSSDFDPEVKRSKRITEEIIDLQTYFYGSLPGDEKILKSEFKADMAFKCHLCRQVYFNNLQFMKHLSLHVENEKASEADLKDLAPCIYCFKVFDTSDELQTHTDLFHLKSDSEFVCQICTENFQWQSHLIHHMVKTHILKELPYMCSICGYRCSNHIEIINHFHREHDRTDKIQCPKCLKSYTLMGERGYHPSVASAFVSHLQSHKWNKNSYCQKCTLNFVHDAYLKNHIARDHASFNEFSNLQPYQYAENEVPIKLVKPHGRNTRYATRKSIHLKPQTQIAFPSQNLEDMVMYNVEKEDCCECNKKMTNPGHYNAYLCCTMCRYSTCCWKAIAIHYSLFHEHSKSLYTLGTPCILENKLYCVCGFSTNSGNKMAKHLGTHNCKSAYPSRKAARAAKIVLSNGVTEQRGNEENDTFTSKRNEKDSPSESNVILSDRNQSLLIEKTKSISAEEDLEPNVENYPISVDQQSLRDNVHVDFSYGDDEIISGGFEDRAGHFLKLSAPIEGVNPIKDRDFNISMNHKKGVSKGFSDIEPTQKFMDYMKATQLAYEEKIKKRKAIRLSNLNIVDERFYKFLTESLNSITAVSYRNNVRHILSYIISEEIAFDPRRILSNPDHIILLKQYYNKYLHRLKYSTGTLLMVVKSMNKFVNFLEFHLECMAKKMSKQLYTNLKSNIESINEIGRVNQLGSRGEKKVPKGPSTRHAKSSMEQPFKNMDKLRYSHIDKAYFFLYRPKILLQYIKRLIMSQTFRLEIQDLIKNFKKYLTQSDGFSKYIRDICAGILFLDGFGINKSVLFNITLKEWNNVKILGNQTLIIITDDNYRIIIDDPLYLDLLCTYETYARPELICSKDDSLPFFPVSQDFEDSKRMKSYFAWIRQTMKKIGINDAHDSELFTINYTSIKNAFFELGFNPLLLKGKVDSRHLTQGSNIDLAYLELKRKYKQLFLDF